MQYLSNAFKNFLFQIGTNTTNAIDSSALGPPPEMPLLAAASATSEIEIELQKRIKARGCVSDFDKLQIQMIEDDYIRRSK